MANLRFTRDVLLLSCGGCGDEQDVDRTRGAQATAVATLAFCDAHLGCPSGPAAATEDVEVGVGERSRRDRGVAPGRRRSA